MVEFEKRAPINEQREKVFEKRAEILGMFNKGVSLRSIKDRVGLGDMPYGSFYRHAVRIRNAAGAQPSMPIQDQSATVDDESALPTHDQLSKKLREPISHPVTTLQPERETTKKPNDNVPQKIAPPKRKPVRPAKQEPKDESNPFDPSNWSDIEI